MLIVLKQTVLASSFDSILNVTASLGGWFFDMSWAGWMALWHGNSTWIACRVGIYRLAWGLEIYKKTHSTSLSRCNLLYWKMLVYVVFKYISYCLVYDGLKSKKQELLEQENIL